jgi:hypothetical protein
VIAHGWRRTAADDAVRELLARMDFLPTWRRWLAKAVGRGHSPGVLDADGFRIIEFAEGSGKLCVLIVHDFPPQEGFDCWWKAMLSVEAAMRYAEGM